MDWDKNVGVMDRFYRAIFGIIFLLAAFFWTESIVRIIFYIFAFILLFNALTGFCLIYKVLGVSTCVRVKEELYESRKRWLLAIIVCFLIIGTIGSYFITKNNFLKDFNKINNDYKTLLLSTSQENRGESINDYERLASDYNSFYDKYYSYRPYAIKGDKEFGKDLREIREIIEEARHKITYGNITAGYNTLETIRPIINDIRIRNELQSNRAAFSEFYGPMKILIDAARVGDIQEVQRAYLIADEKLKYIESFANNSEVGLIRINLDSVYNLAQAKEAEKIPSRAAELKSSYLKAYLQAG